jgi:hypothetical protein
MIAPLSAMKLDMTFIDLPSKKILPFSTRTPSHASQERADHIDFFDMSLAICARGQQHSKGNTGYSENATHIRLSSSAHNELYAGPRMVRTQLVNAHIRNSIAVFPGGLQQSLSRRAFHN